jgi:hypothetical protein
VVRTLRTVRTVARLGAMRAFRRMMQERCLPGLFLARSFASGPIGVTIREKQPRSRQLVWSRAVGEGKEQAGAGVRSGVTLLLQGSTPRCNCVTATASWKRQG